MLRYHQQHKTTLLLHLNALHGGRMPNTKRSLETAATTLLGQHGCARDGRPHKEHAPEQDGFEREVLVKPQMEKLRPHDPHRHRL